MGRETVGKRDFNKRGERLPENRTDCFRPVAAYALALPRLVAFSGSLYVSRRGYLKMSALRGFSIYKYILIRIKHSHNNRNKRNSYKYHLIYPWVFKK